VARPEISELPRNLLRINQQIEQRR